MLVILLVCLCLHGSQCVIHSLNKSEYRRMPALYALDDYDICMSEVRAAYCVTDLDLFSEEPSDLMHLIHEYSADTKKHFNHTQIHRGVCVTRQCRLLNNNSWDLDTTLEVCLNETISRDYNLQVRVNKIHYCKRDDDKTVLDTGDLAVIIVYLLLLAFNVVGSLYDVLFCHQSSKSGNPYVLSFSLKRNWAKLILPSGVGPDPRLERLKSFQGLRSLTIVCVIFSHAALVIGASYLENPQYIETAFDDPGKQILFNGSLITHTFFVMSSFLLAYNIEINAEKHKMSLWDFPKGILLRFIRLTPTYALILATISTVLRHMGSGPLWDLIVTKEANDCRQQWWAHILYLQNYVSEGNICMTETWYLAADMQLFCLGLLVCLACRRSRAKKLALGALFLLSLVITATITYSKNLDPIVIQAPETLRAIYSKDRTFRLMYTPGHTNLSTYVLGLSGGFLAHHWQANAHNADKFKKFCWMVWITLPLGVLLILSGGVFYADVDVVPLAFKVAYATLYKPLFQLLVVVFIMSCIFKVESLYRSIVEWRGFTWAGRLTYGVYLLHATFQRSIIGSQIQTTFASDYNVLTVLAATTLISFLAAGLLWLCVEAPVAALSKAIFTRRKRVESK